MHSGWHSKYFPQHSLFSLQLSEEFRDHRKITFQRYLEVCYEYCILLLRLCEKIVFRFEYYFPKSDWEQIRLLPIFFSPEWPFKVQAFTSTWRLHVHARWGRGRLLADILKSRYTFQSFPLQCKADIQWKRQRMISNSTWGRLGILTIPVSFFVLI